MDIARARWLVSDAGRGALAGLAPALAALPPHRLADTLRGRFAPFEGSALAEQLTLRAKARDRFGHDLGFLYTSDGLEMMTHPAVAARRAVRLAALGLPVADLTCGLGGDLAAIASTGIPTVGLEHDPTVALFAAANVPAAAVAGGDAAHPPLDLASCAVVIDPSRRDARGRRFDPAAFSPPWDVAVQLLASARAGVLKAPPGIDHRHIPPQAEAEFVQLGRSLREAAVWIGEGALPGLRRAVLLPAGVTLGSNAPGSPAPVQPPAAFLFDPESCVTRAGLVRQLAFELNAWLVDPQIAYLSASAPAFHPLSATFEILDQLPFSVARLRDSLRRSSRVPTEIRRRAFPVEPDELRRLLGPLTGEPVTLLLTTIAGKRIVFVVRRLFPPAPAAE